MKLTPGLVALVTLALLVLIGFAGAVAISMRGAVVPIWLSTTLASLVPLMVGLAMPSPLQSAPKPASE